MGWCMGGNMEYQDSAGWLLRYRLWLWMTSLVQHDSMCLWDILYFCITRGTGGALSNFIYINDVWVEIPSCMYTLGFKAELVLRILHCFRYLISCVDPPCRLIGWYLPGSRDPRHPSVFLLGCQTAGHLFGHTSRGSGESSRAKCCCPVGICALPNRSRLLSGSVGYDYTTPHGNIHI